LIEKIARPATSVAETIALSVAGDPEVSVKIGREAR